MREFGLSILPSSWCEAGVRNIGFLDRVWHHFGWRVPSSCSSQLGFELDYYCYLLNRTPFFGGKITPKIKLLFIVPYRGRDQKNLNFHVFFSSTLIGKNNSIRVERHKLLLVISKEQANEKDHYCINSKKTVKNRTSYQ